MLQILQCNQCSVRSQAAQWCCQSLCDIVCSSVCNGRYTISVCVLLEMAPTLQISVTA